MSERDEFEAWIRECEGHPFAGQFANLMWRAWQARAARATPQQAVPALTDEQRKAAAKALVEVYLGFPAPDRDPGEIDLRAVDAVASIILAASQPSPESRRYQD